MQLSCRACGKLIPAADVNIDKAIAKCQACNAVFSFLDQIADQGRVSRPQAELPKGYRVENWGQELTIAWRWYGHGLWFLLLFCILWDGFLVVWYSIGIGGLLTGKADPGFWIMLVFPVLHVAVGIGLTYAVLCGFINRTTIAVWMGELSVKHGPIPCFGNHRLLTADIEQLYCTQTRRNTKHGCRYSYNVMLRKRGGTKLKLIGNLQELDQAIFLEQQLEQHLKIDDVRVPGEALA